MWRKALAVTGGSEKHRRQGCAATDRILCACSVSLFPSAGHGAGLPQVINFWTGAVEYAEDGQALNEPNPPTIDEARAAFPDCSFIGA